jgi:hypothetical protein
MSKPPSIGREGRVSAAPNVHCRRFDDELVMVDLEGGEYFSLDGVGARMWDLLRAGKTPDEVGAELAAEYDADKDKIVCDCTTLADDLLERGLLINRTARST